MTVTQVIKWQASDYKEFDTEYEAVTHEDYLIRYEELGQVLDQIWYSAIDKTDVIKALLDNFIFTKKES